MQVRHADEGVEAGEGVDPLAQAIALVEKANADLEPELLRLPQARARLELYARARRVVDFGVAALARRVEDAAEVSRATGTSLGQA
ncbi:MAG TPA: hypothetical protein VHK89_09065, partial [Actinomycetota bacterium]|nr:hypothetical protein [Actinomycetota bacterium]